MVIILEIIIRLKTYLVTINGEPLISVKNCGKQLHQASEGTQNSCDRGVLFFHYYLAASTTTWAQIVTGLLLYTLCWNTPGDKTGLWQLPIASIVFKCKHLWVPFLWDDERMYSYVRFQDVDGTTGARKKMYAFITWIGPSVSPLAKARVSTDKAFVKQIFTVSINYGFI